MANYTTVDCLCFFDSDVISHNLQMRVLLENTAFSLHKIVRNEGIIKIGGIIQGRVLYEEIRNSKKEAIVSLLFCKDII